MDCKDSDNFSKLIVDIYEQSIVIDDINESINFIKTKMNTEVHEFLSEFRENALLYAKERDSSNEELLTKLSLELQILNEAFKFSGISFKILPMSSLTSSLNLIEGSDIDIGLCIQNLTDQHFNDDEQKLRIADEILLSCGYKYEKKVGYSLEWKHKNNRYTCYSKFIGEVEFEVKVRDLENTKVFIDLHEKLDREISQEKKALYTFGKLLLKDHLTKKLFKTLIYMEYFDGISGAFKLPVV